MAGFWVVSVRILGVKKKKKNESTKPDWMLYVSILLYSLGQQNCWHWKNTLLLILIKKSRDFFSFLFFFNISLQFTLQEAELQILSVQLDFLFCFFFAFGFREHISMQIIQHIKTIRNEFCLHRDRGSCLPVLKPSEWWPWHAVTATLGAYIQQSSVTSKWQTTFVCFWDTKWQHLPWR